MWTDCRFNFKTNDGRKSEIASDRKVEQSIELDQIRQRIAKVEFKYSGDWLVALIFYGDLGQEQSRIGWLQELPTLKCSSKTIELAKNETIVGVRGKFYDSRQLFSDF